MRFVRYLDGGTAQWGIETDGTIHSLGGLPDGPPSLEEIATPAYREPLRAKVARDELPSVDPTSVRRLAPVSRPGNVICVGLNYHDHAEEQDEEIPETPLLFSKSSSAVTNPGDPIVRPDGVDQVDYEVELAIVIGRTARNVPAEDATEYVAGYTIVNDVSAGTPSFPTDSSSAGRATTPSRRWDRHSPRAIRSTRTAPTSNCA